MNAKPERLNILGIPYAIVYCDKPSDVDINSRLPMVGCIDYWKREIRIYDRERPIEDIWETILHEVLHGVASDLHLEFLQKCEDNDLDLLALALNDFLFRNDLIMLENRETKNGQ